MNYRRFVLIKLPYRGLFYENGLFSAKYLFHHLNQKKAILVSCLLIIQTISQGQLNDGLVELGKAYRQYMFRSSAPGNVINSLGKYSGTELSFAASFIKETISENNSLLSEEFLKRPGDTTMRYIYIIRQINFNVRKEEPADNNSLIQEFLGKDIPVNELLDSYYAMLFDGYGNKNKPFDLTNTDFELEKYRFQNDTEKAIFFLRAMRMCGSFIWGYMNVVKPPNYDEAIKYIDKYPKFNGGPYYQFLDLNFPDFKINIETGKKKQSYKEFYIDKYYETLLYHLQCLQQTEANQEKIYNLVLGSVLKEEMFYKYSNQEKELKKLFVKYTK